MASFHARAATNPSEDVASVSVWIAIFLDIFVTDFFVAIGKLYYDESMAAELFSRDDFANNRSLGESESKYSSGQITIIGGSELFHGAPILALKGASRLVSMTFFASPVEDRGVVERIKSSLGSFVWVPFEDLDSYIEKSDAILIGPGLMRSHINEKDFVCDEEGMITRDITKKYLRSFLKKRWLVDGGSLQVISVNDLPEGAAVTPNKKEFEMLFGEELLDDIEKRGEQIMRLAAKHKLVILSKDAVSLVSDGKRLIRIEGGNDGLVKGGVGDVIAGVAVGFMAKNEPLFSLAAASYLVKKAADRLAEKKDLMFNSDDIADEVPKVYGEIVKNLRSPH